MPSLNDRRRTETRIHIADAAVALFAQSGFDAVTMDDVARAAEVSRRTVYRHFATKEDLIFDHPTRWLDHFESVIAARDVDESTRDVCCRALIAVAEFIQSTGDAVAEAFAVYATNPGVRARGAHTEDRWIQRYAELITADVGDAVESQLKILTLAGSLVATTNALVMVWAQHRPDFDMADLTRVALTHIDPLWPEECRKRPVKD